MKRAAQAFSLGFLVFSGPQAGAGEGLGAPDFTFRRVAVPPPGATRLITIQIDPEEQARYLAIGRRPASNRRAGDRTPARQPQPDAARGAYGWFWDLVSPGLAEAAPARLEPAVAALGQGPEGRTVPAPRLEALQTIADRYGRDILLATVDTRVSPALALAVISVESSGIETAQSPAGASGLMQLIPATAARFSVADPTVPADNIRGGVAYLDWLMKKFNGDPVLVLAAYNAGENAVISNRGVPPFAETRDYVPRVLAAWTVARGLCLTPPELLSDGCVFAVREARKR